MLQTVDKQTGAAPVPARAWAEVDLGALERNVEALKRFSGNRHLMVMVKANAYGHGAAPIARAALAAGASFLGVADVTEGISLRCSGIEAPIVVLGSILPEEVEPALQHALQLAVSPCEILEVIAAAACRLETVASLHLMVDTGMTRYGISGTDALESARRISAHGSLKLVGLATHFVASEDEALERSEGQLAEFTSWLQSFEEEELLPPFIHAANSAALIRLPGSHFNLARPGIAVYGIYPHPGLRECIDLEPVLSVRAKLALVREVPAGTSIGYGATWTTRQPTLLANVPVGYADGWPTSLSNRGYALVCGQKAPIAGKVSMDSLVLDVGHVPGVGVGQTVTLLGRDGEAAIRAEELARLSGRIPYEVTCGIGPRIRYLFQEPPCASSDPSFNALKRSSSQVSSLAPSPSA